MGTFIRNDLIKILRHPSMLWLGGFFLLFQIYAYVKAGSDYKEIVQSFMKNTDWSMEQIEEYVIDSPLTDPLKAYAHVLDPGMVVSYNLGIINVVGPFVIIIFAAISIGNEYQNGTIRTLWTSGFSRFKILLSKLFTLQIITLLIMVVLCLTGFFLSWITHYMYSIPYVETVSILSKKTGLQILATWTSLTLWSMLAAMLAAITRSSLTGIVVGILYPVLASSVFTQFSIKSYLPLWNQKSTLPIAFEDIKIGVIGFSKRPEMVSFEMGIIVSIVYVLIFFTLWLIVWLRQETTTG